MPNLVSMFEVYQLAKVLQTSPKFVVVMKSIETNREYIKGEYSMFEKAARQALLGEVKDSQDDWWVEARIGDTVRVLVDCPHNSQQVFRLKNLFAGETD